MKKLCVYFASGCLGGLVNSLVVWLFGYLGVTSRFGVSIAPSLSPGWLYPRIVWGGIWGIMFILPLLKSKLLTKGMILSLFPTAVQLFFLFPFQYHKGFGGIELGLFTPLFVLFFNWVWGVVTAITIKVAK